MNAPAGVSHGARIALVPYAVLVAYSLWWPSAPVEGPGRIDLLGHLLLFFGLGLLTGLAFGSRLAPPVVVGVAVAGEVVQLALPERMFQWSDLVANVIGCAIGLWAAHWRRPDPADG